MQRNTSIPASRRGIFQHGLVFYFPPVVPDAKVGEASKPFLCWLLLSFKTHMFSENGGIHGFSEGLLPFF